MTIIIQSIPRQEELKITSLHHGVLHSELAAQVPSFHGVSTSDKAYAHFHTTIAPELQQQIKDALAGYEARLDEYDIRVKLLEQLRAKFGDKIVDLALIHGDAVVSVRGDVDPVHIAKAHEVAAKHDPDKAPAEPVVLSDAERIAHLEKLVAELMKRK